MVNYVWFDEIIKDKAWSNCKCWYPAIILTADSEEDAWEKLYKFSKIEWAKYQYNKEIMLLPSNQEIEADYHLLRINNEYKLKTAITPKQFNENEIITWNANY